MTWEYMATKHATLNPHQWIKSVREDLELTQPEVVQKIALLGITMNQSYLSKIERGVQPLKDVSGVKLEALRRIYKLSHQQWESYTGVVIDANSRRLPFDRNSQIAPLMNEHSARELTDYIIRPIEPLSAAAGSPELIENTNSDVYIMPRADFRNSLRFFTADGESMTRGDGKGIQHGDTLIVDTAMLEPKVNEVYVVQDQTGAVCVKRVQIWDDAYWLTSDNPRYPPFQLDEARVLGEVVKVEGEREF